LANGCHGYVYRDRNVDASSPFKLFTNRDGINLELDLPKDFWAYTLFETKIGFWIFGPMPDKFGGLFVESSTHGLKITDKITISWAGDVLDMDPSLGMLLVKDDSDMFSRWYLYNIADGKSESLGFASKGGIFLREDMAYAVKHIFNLVK